MRVWRVGEEVGGFFDEEGRLRVGGCEVFAVSGTEGGGGGAEGEGGNWDWDLDCIV